MKGQRIFPGIILIGFGLYFFLERSQIHIFTGFYTGPLYFVLLDLPFSFRPIMAKTFMLFFLVLYYLALALHFHLGQLIEAWPSNFGIFILIISIGFILQARKTKSGMF